MDLQKLVAIFEHAQSGASPGDEYAGNPLKWPVVRGVKAVADEYEARIKKLEGALRRIANCETWVYGELVDIARSALTGKE